MITIKRLGPPDLKTARELFVYFQIDDGIEEPSIPSDQYLEALLRKEDFYVLAALDQEILAGGLTAFSLPLYKTESLEMFLYEIGIKPAYRQQGIAQQLINSLLALCRDLGISELFVGTSPNNKAAIKLYETSGGKAGQEHTVMFTYFLLNSNHTPS